MKILIFGNSGSGKSHLSKRLAAASGSPVMDLDAVVWSGVAEIRPDEQVEEELRSFVAENPSWIIEGCYGRWMEHLLPKATEIVFMNPGEAACIDNCLKRHWEAHKYASKDEQDARLPFLLDWVRDYYTRSDDMSLQAHRRIFDSYQGTKTEVTSNH